METVQASLIRTEGTSLIFKTNPTVGILTLTGFVDDQTLVVDADFTKIFRYTKNGVIYSDWLDLTIDNITSIVLEKKDIFIAEINYKKNPSDAEINVSGIGLTYESDPTFEVGSYFKNSLFSNYFQYNDVEALNWHVNVLEKVYKKGLIANFIQRSDDSGSSDDFLALWGSVTKFFSFYVRLAREYSRFYNNDSLLREFLTQRGLIVSPENNLVELQKILSTYYYQMSKRGTYGVMEDEVLRLIHNKLNIDEYIWCLYRKHHFGWNMSNSSPLYRSLRMNDSLNKIAWSPKYTSVENASNYTTGQTITDNGNKVISLGYDQVLFFENEKAVIVDPNLDYQISFKIKLSGKFDLIGTGYTIDGASESLLSKKTGLTERHFFNDAVLSRSDMYLTVRCVVCNHRSGVDPFNQTNIRQGQNLMFSPNNKKFGLALLIKGTALVYDFKMIPLLTIYSRGFLQSNNFMSLWLTNRNGEYSGTELKQYISKYLIPYNCHLKITETDKYRLSINTPKEETFYWVGAGEYCRKSIWIGTDESCEFVSTIWVPDETTAYCEQQT